MLYILRYAACSARRRSKSNLVLPTAHRSLSNRCQGVRPGSSLPSSRQRSLRTHLRVLHFAQDFGSQAFHLLGVVEEQAELDEFGSRIRDLAQTGDAG